MRKSISAISAISLMVLLPVAAQAGASKQESIGVGTGAIVGAAAGGPVGFIVGAAIGASIGDKVYRKDREIQSLSDSLEASRSEVLSLEHNISQLDTDIDELSAELGRMRGMTRPEVLSLLRSGIATDLLFRTDESVLADSTGIRLNRLATTLAAMPGIRIQLDGFADERGEKSYNQELSERRAAFVRDQLVAAGVDESRITLVAHGESTAQDASADSYALERRVSLTLFIDNTPSVAVNPD